MYDTIEYQRQLFVADYENGMEIVERYLALLSSPKYLKATGRENLTSPPNSDHLPRPKKESKPLPANLIVTGRKITPLLELKIHGALAVCPSVVTGSRSISIHGLFMTLKHIGYRWNVKLERWEFS